MGLIKKLFKGAAVAGTAVAAVKVADQIKADNPDGIKDLNGDGKVNYKDYAIAAKQAAGETFANAKEAVNEKTEEIKEKASEERAEHEGNYVNPYSAKTADYFPDSKAAETAAETVAETVEAVAEAAEAVAETIAPEA